MMPRKMALPMAIVALVASTMSAHAQTYCSEPRKPYCIDGYGTFDDEYSFQSCRSDMERFKRQTNDYVECLSTAQDDAIRAYNKAVESFNCHASGKSYCF